MQRETHTIDANGKPLGRLATEIVYVLSGKNKTGYVPNQDMGDFVIVKNASKVKLTGKKAEQKVYYSHTGYLGGLKKLPIKKTLVGNSVNYRNAIWRAVYGMLPKNKLRILRIKRLKVEY